DDFWNLREFFEERVRLPFDSWTYADEMLNEFVDPATRFPRMPGNLLAWELKLLEKVAKKAFPFLVRKVVGPTTVNKVNERERAVSPPAASRSVKLGWGSDRKLETFESQSRYSCFSMPSIPTEKLSDTSLRDLDGLEPDVFDEKLIAFSAD